MCNHVSVTWHTWRRGSVVRTSVSGWRTFPDVCLIYGWHVTTSWVRCPLWVNQPGKLSLPSCGVGKWVVIHVTFRNGKAQIPLGSTRLDSTRHIRHVEPMHFGCVELVEQRSSTRSTRRARLARLAWHVELDRRYLQLSYYHRNSFIV